MSDGRQDQGGVQPPVFWLWSVVCLGEILLGSGGQHVRATTYRPPIGVELSQSFPTKQDKKRHIEDDLHEASYLLLVVVVVVVVVVSGE